MRDIDTIISTLKERHPLLQVEQLQVKFPGVDDDGIWFFSHPESRYRVQLESSYGVFPFIVEGDDPKEVGRAGTLAEAVRLLESWLRLPVVSS
jgi:hypothetical protein